MGIRRELAERYDTEQRRLAIWRRDRGRCVVCGEPYWEIHEVISKSHWASNERDMELCYSMKNSVCVDRKCHDEYQGRPNKMAELFGILRDRYRYVYTEPEFVRYLDADAS